MTTTPTTIATIESTERLAVTTPEVAETVLTVVTNTEDAETESETAAAIVYDAESALSTYLSKREAWLTANTAKFYNWLGRTKPGSNRTYRLTYSEDESRIVSLLFTRLQDQLHEHNITLVRKDGGKQGVRNVVLFAVDREIETTEVIVATTPV